MVRWGGHRGQCELFYQFRGDLPIPNVRYGFGMVGTKPFGAVSATGRARMEKLLALLQYGRVDPVR